MERKRNDNSGRGACCICVDVGGGGQEKDVGEGEEAEASLEAENERSVMRNKRKDTNLSRFPLALSEMRGCNNAVAQDTYLIGVISVQSTISGHRKGDGNVQRENLVTPETTDPISTNRDDPRLSRVPLGIENTE